MKEAKAKAKASAKKPAGGEAAGVPAAADGDLRKDDLPDSREGAVTPAMDDPVTILDERTLTIQEAVQEATLLD